MQVPNTPPISATALIDIDGVVFLTDPYFSPAGTEWDVQVAVLKYDHNPAQHLENMYMSPIAQSS